MAVVQFGLAIIGAPQMESPFICGTTRGTFSSYLNTDELSITTAQAFTADGANFVEFSPQAANRAKSSPSKKSSVTSLISMSHKKVSTIFQALLELAQSLNSHIGISLGANYTLAGRNVGKATVLSGAIIYNI